MNRHQRRAKAAVKPPPGNWAEVRRVKIGRLANPPHEHIAVTLMLGPQGFTAEWENRPSVLTDAQFDLYRRGRNELAQTVADRMGMGLCLYEEETATLYGFIPGASEPTKTFVPVSGRILPPS